MTPPNPAPVTPLPAGGAATRSEPGGTNLTRPYGDAETHGAERPAWRALGVWLLVAVIAAILFAWLARAWQALSILLLLALAALALGALIGFLFGIPAQSGGNDNGGAGAGAAQTQPSPRASDGVAEPGATASGAAQTAHTASPSVSPFTAATSNGSAYRPSNSLEQIAEWLTKLLIGASLVELHGVATALGQLGRNVAASLGGSPKTVSVAAQALAVGFVVAGFLAGYLWTRLHYGAIQARVDRSILGLLRHTEERVEEANAKAENAQRGVGELAPRVLPSDLPAAGGPGVRAEAAAPPLSLATPEVRAAVAAFDQAPDDWDSDPAADLFPKARREANGRRLEARVVSALDRTVMVRLSVARTVGAPLVGTVMFLLHPTFDTPTVAVEPRGDIAETTIYAAGAFTVVGIADDGKTVLKYDLATLPHAPAWFRES